MKFNIYNYADEPIEIEAQDKSIDEIFVQIFSGDETIIIIYADNDKDEFDSSNDRIASYDDGFYLVSKQHLDEWMNWKPQKDERCYSYHRQRQFDR